MHKHIAHFGGDASKVLIHVRLWFGALRRWQDVCARCPCVDGLLQRDRSSAYGVRARAAVGVEYGWRGVAWRGVAWRGVAWWNANRARVTMQVCVAHASKVTIWGESAGASTVTIHLVSPPSFGLYRSFIF